jgi:hypothetical protein
VVAVAATLLAVPRPVVLAAAAQAAVETLVEHFLLLELLI